MLPNQKKHVTYFMPTSEFGRNMLTTIPKKVRAWLDNLGKFEPPYKGIFRNLTWNIQNDQTKLSSILIDGEEPVEIYWDGTWEHMFTPRGSEEWMLNIEHNMEKFVALEQRIYDELEEMQRELDKERERDFQALSADRA